LEAFSLFFGITLRAGSTFGDAIIVHKAIVTAFQCVAEIRLDWLTFLTILGHFKLSIAGVTVQIVVGLVKAAGGTVLDVDIAGLSVRGFTGLAVSTFFANLRYRSDR